MTVAEEQYWRRSHWLPQWMGYFRRPVGVKLQLSLYSLARAVFSLLFPPRFAPDRQLLLLFVLPVAEGRRLVTQERVRGCLSTTPNTLPFSARLNPRRSERSHRQPERIRAAL